MKENNKVYWKGIEELNNEPEFVKNAQSEFPEYLPVGGDDSSAPDRRDFLKLLGFSVAAVSLAACEAPVKKAIPYLNKPEEVEPGIPNYYASTFTEGGDYCAVLVKTREGRPIKVEGNPDSSVSLGVTGARVQASVLSLYDSARLNGFRALGKAATQAAVDAEVTKQLENIAAAGGAIRIVSQTILSPTTKKAIAEFKAKYTTTEHVVYDADSAYGLTKANELHFGEAFVPTYDFSKANVIVSFGADFLGTWLSPVEYAKQYAVTRKLGKSKKTMSRHYQFETELSLTGSNADHRVPVKPSQEGLLVAELYKKVTGNSNLGTPDLGPNEMLDKIVADLRKPENAGRSLVVSGSNDVNVQLLINEINKALGNYGNTIDLTPSYFRQGNDEQMNAFVSELKEGKVAAVIFYGANPVYDHPLGADIKAALTGKKAQLSVSFADREDETASLVQYVAPDHHYLEAWNDAEPRKGFYSLGQPTIAPVFKTRAAQESLLTWAGNKTSYYDYLRNNWNSTILAGADWDTVLERGVYEPGKKGAVAAPVASDSTAVAPVTQAAVVSGSVSLRAVDLDIAGNLSKAYKKSSTETELKLYKKIGIATGAQANNPWLQELPDPISKATWGNYVAISRKQAELLKLAQNDVVKVIVNGKELGKLPVLIQPGQANQTVSIALGYGRAVAGKSAAHAGGISVIAANTLVNGAWSGMGASVKLEPTGETEKIAQTQTHHTIMNRPIIQDATFAEYKDNAEAGRYKPMITTPDGKKKPMDVDLWKNDHPRVGHLWGMNIDLNSCIGCGSCVVACQAENNVPVVGKREVINRREMHWIRIDRYYSAEVDEKNISGKYFAGGYNPAEFEAMEHPTDNPQVTFQPMMCQQCNHAPCETVCPVAATTHSSEGLNQMAYNRCVGTRYCANNCPFKVRRFNWFKYFDNKQFADFNVSQNDALGRTVLNPDVTVRSRGVMEKCSFCVQRIQAGKLKAKMERRKLEDGEIQTACAAACATGAIKFGDQNDSASAVAKETNEENKERSYVLLEELNVQPNIYYLTKIRNVNA